ncbi:MAG: nitroreductase family protein [Bacteroidales bacterium]|nr:nitroreductase family protein [Bacteroidales bacterium]
MLKDLILRNRSYRRFDESFFIDKNVLLELVDLARLSPSGGNLQPLKFFLSFEADKNVKIFDCLSWAGYLSEWNGPEKGERPTAYIIILGDLTIKNEVKNDQGIAAQSMLLGATEKGLGGCIIGSVNKEKLRALLKIPSHLEILLVVALGKPIEKIELENLPENDDIKYWRDLQGVHHVPKRNLNDLIIS